MEPPRENAGQNDQQEYSTFLYKFQQQIIGAWKPVPHTSSNVILYLILSIICIALGLGLILSAPSTQEVYVQYGKACAVDQTYSSTYNPLCQVTFTLTETLHAPIYMYYGLNGFYQNHRRYLKFFSTQQLSTGTQSESDAMASCGSFVTNAQCQYSNTPASAVAFPCGTIARVYNKLKQQIKSFKIDGVKSYTQTGIAWVSDIGRHLNWDLTKQPFSVTDETWLVWFRPAARSDFYKLNGIINSDLAPGTHTVTFLNHLDYSFGSKWFSISKSNFVGNRDLFLGIAFLALGAGCFFLLIVFLAKWISEKRKGQKGD